MSSKSLTNIVFSGLFTLALLVPTSELKAEEHSSTISSESSAFPDNEIDIFSPDLKKTFPLEDLVESNSGLNNDQVCNKCGEIENEEVVKEQHQMDSEN